MNWAPPCSICACQLSGWIQKDLFTQQFRHFILHVKATEENPTLLILDKHYSYTRNSYIINFAREHHVSVISLPPHSTHKVQSLDLSFMAPLTTFYAQEIEEWIRINNNRVMKIYQVAELFGVLISALLQEGVQPMFSTKLGFPLVIGTYFENTTFFLTKQVLIRILLS